MSDDDHKKLSDEYGNIHTIDKELARGGQGVVYRTQDEDLAIKQPLYHQINETDKSKEHNMFQRIRTLPLPRGLSISLPLAILRDEPGYVMRLLTDMQPFTRFTLNGEQRRQMQNKDCPDWLSGLQDETVMQNLTYYAETGSTRARLYALYKCAMILARLHNAGMVYGDISANNVFIGENIPSECWLIDADNLRYELRSGGKTVYTPQLGAPEIVQGKDAARPRTDCWAFAVMAFQLLACCHPFIGRKVLEPEEDCGWDVPMVSEEIPADMDERAYAGYLPFIDDANDDSNDFPNGGLPRQLVLSGQLQQLFQETLGEGRLNPHRRPAMMYWAWELARAFDNSVQCPHCHMSYFFEKDVDSCPYCQTSRPALAIARTSRWQKILQSPGNMSFKISLPHRLLHAFSLSEGDSTEYEADVNLQTKRIRAVRGTKALPSDIDFDFIPACYHPVQRQEDEK